MRLITISNGKITREGKKIDSIFHVLNMEVEFSETLTMHGFLKALAPFKDEVNLAFASQLGRSNFQYYLDEAAKKASKHEFTEDIDYCEVHWAVDYSKIKKYESFYQWPNFHGCKNKDKITYGLDFSPINSYKNKPLKLNQTLDIGLLHLVDKKLIRTPVLKAKKLFSFFEAVGCVLDDMSFYGPPETRNKTADEIFKDSNSYLKEAEKIVNNKSKIKWKK